MISEHVRITFQHFGKLASQGLHNARVHLNALAFEHGAVSGILQQGVLEGVYGVRNNAVLVNQFGSNKSPGQRLEFGVGEVAYSPDQRIGEFTPERCSSLYYRAQRREPVQPGNQ